MILVDSNLLIYAVHEGSAHHKAAREWLDARLSEPGRVGLPWSSLLSFLRLITNPRIFEKPAAVSDAWACVEGWLDSPNVWIPLPTEGYRPVLAGLLKTLDRGANLVPDAEVAALSIEHGLTLCTADRGFARFPGLKWVNPLP